MIVVINGPCGVGKSETSERLIERFDGAVSLDGDHLGAVHPFVLDDERRVDHLYATLHHLVAFHQQHGFRTFVINYVFETPASLARLLDLLRPLDPDVRVFRLTASPETLEARIRQRNRATVDWECGRSRELTAILEAAGDVGEPIDTTGLGVEQVVQAINARTQTKSPT
jgi:tRNA A37 N6-isopentenylltransferase MiaA